MSDPRITLQELSEAAGVSPERVRALVDVGIIPDRAGEAPFEAADVHRIRLAQGFEASGLSLEAIGTAIAAGRLSFDFVDTMFGYRAPLAGRTYREVAADLGVPLETLTLLYAMWGLPRPGPDDVIREDDALIFTEWKALFPPEALNEQLLTQGARLFGEVTSRLADWGMAVYRTYVEAPLLAAEMSPRDTITATSAFAGVSMSTMERQLSWLLRRKLEHTTFQLIVEYVENAVDAGGSVAARGTRPPAICFVDLSGYTALTEELGDRAAAERAGRFGTLVQEAANAHGGNVIKLLGDGAMLLIPDPSEAVSCGLEIVERAAVEGLPAARVGLAAGPVVFQDGDCYGRVVNVAARIMGKASANQVVTTGDVVTFTADHARFESVGPVELKGIAEPIELFVAAGP